MEKLIQTNASWAVSKDARLVVIRIKNKGDDSVVLRLTKEAAKVLAVDLLNATR